jgi:hypothetical protein
VTSPVGRWTGLEATLLRLARRMTVRQFSDHLGITSRMIARWSNTGRSIQPRTEYQLVLDESLRRCTDSERQRFEQLLHERDRRPPEALDRLRWCLVVEVPPSNPALVAQLELAVNDVLMSPFNDDYLI